MVVFISFSESASLKRSASPDYNSENSESGMDRINVSYDEYPVSSKFGIVILSSQYDWKVDFKNLKLLAKIM